MRFKPVLMFFVLCFFAMSFLFPGPGSQVPAAQAATANPSPASTGYTPMLIPVMGNYTTTRTGIVKWKAPNGYRIVAANATARQSGGTSPTLKVRGNSGSFTIFSTSVTAGTVADAKLSASPKMTDEDNVTLDMVIGGTSPVWRDITFFILLKRL